MSSHSFSLSGNIVDIHQRELFRGKIDISDGIITAITHTPESTYDVYLTPGLVDAHVHVESSMLPPSEFARAASIHGTVATVSDPHEIANVLGIEGVKWMLKDAQHSPFKFYFGAPSCVPATPFETAGASLGPQEIESLLNLPEIKYLAEVMNFPAVIEQDPAMMTILGIAKKLNKHIDGHSPGVMGEALKKYVAAGIETDHECTTIEEGKQRLELGMKVAIREGSAAKNFDALWPLIHDYPNDILLCSDDKHPDDLIVSHLNALLARLLGNGVDLFTALRSATINPTQHYGLEVGLLRIGDPADIVEWNDLSQFIPQRTWINGELVAEKGHTKLKQRKVTPVNHFNTQKKTVTDFEWQASNNNPLQRVITVLDGQLITDEALHLPKVEAGKIISDTHQDLLKITVVNRYQNSRPATALIKNFGLKNSAMASSVAHDSHNIVAVGSDDTKLCQAINLVIQHEGGLSAVTADREKILPLSIAGLMGTDNAWAVAQDFSELTGMIKDDGCPLTSPFMSLSFMALLVIPKLKLSDKGLFDVDTFSLLEN